jgi:putative ABC transport system substrate-binding protein
VEAAKIAAEELGLTLIEEKATTKEQVLSMTKNIPPNIDGIFFPNDRLIGSVIEEFLNNTNSRQLPSSVNNIAGMDLGALMAYGPEFKEIGAQGARLAHQILLGAPASQIPVELPELFLGINLQVAKQIGISIPDEILRLAFVVIR